jgi:hypothetical protein
VNARYLTVAATDDPVGVEVTDDIQGVTTRIETATPVVPRASDPSSFVFPVDAAARLATNALRIPQHVTLVVRDGDGRVVAEAGNREELHLPAGEYVVEVASLVVKTYLAVEGSLVSTTDEVGRRLLVEGAESVALGVRSRHEFPAATVTTTDRPADLARALSCLGSALKTDSPERSWPTLRGHPPLVELGESFEAPPGFEREGDPVRIVVPGEVGSLFPVAPLAYYTDASVELGEWPRLVVDGAVFPLDGAAGLAATAARTLERLFTLDCVVRTEGLYPIDLHARRVLEGRLPFDPATVYDADPAERLRSYLETPHDVVAPAIPTWKSTVDLAPAAENVAFVPFAAADLARVRCPRPTVPAADSEASEAADAFFRGGRSSRATRSGADDAPFGEDVRVVQPEPTDTIEHAWVGDGVPMGASKPTLAACERRLDAQPSGTIDVAVVSNDPEMRAESDVRERYGLRELVAFDIDTFEDLTGAELAAVLADDYDFVHYVGHVDDDGMQCVDGPLDARSLDGVGARAFVLNACRSYEQGLALVERGAIAGVVTLAEVGNDPATQVGRTLARLLNAGFSLAGALGVLRTGTITGRQYTVIGDAQVQIATTRSGTPMYATVDPDDDGYRVELYGYPTTQNRLGAVYSPHIGDATDHYLNSGYIDEFDVDEGAFDRFLDTERFPIGYGERLTWSDTVRSERRSER